METHTSRRSSPPHTILKAAPKRSKARFFLPLSDHGMPKTPHHPFSSLRSTRSPPPMSPESDGFSTPLMSPSLVSPGPMSARSFNTFIESEPSTPAWSPRGGSAEWDGSALMLLSPVQSDYPSQEPSPADCSPVEPEWEMLTPHRKSSGASATSTSTSQSQETRSRANSVQHTTVIAPSTSLASHPPAPLPLLALIEEKSGEKFEKENVPPYIPAPSSYQTQETKSSTPVTEDSSNGAPAPLGKLASRMKSILRRKAPANTQKDKADRRRRAQKQELDRMEDVHWTEM